MNVLVGENGTAVLSDFGLAKAVMAGSKTSSSAPGTIDYMCAVLGAHQMSGLQLL